MKRFLSMFLTVIILCSMGATAFAASGEDGGKGDGRIAALEERQQRIGERREQNKAKQAQLATKAEEYEAFWQALTQHREDVLKNADANLGIAAEISQLRQDLLTAMSAIKKSGTQLPEETADKLESYNSQLLELTSNLKDTQGRIKDIKSEYRGYVKNKDYAAMDTAFAEIEAVQQERYDLLTQIKGFLQEMDTLLDGLSENPAV